MKKSAHYYFRKIHRYFGVIIGIQFLFWTLGGLFFAWSNMDQIHSDTYKTEPTYFDNSIEITSPQHVIKELNKKFSYYEIEKLELINVLNNPVYRARISISNDAKSKFILADATTGEVRPWLTKDESLKLATDIFLPNSPIKEVEYITEKTLGIIMNIEEEYYLLMQLHLIIHQA